MPSFTRYFATSLLVLRDPHDGWIGVSIEFGVEVRNSGLDAVIAGLIDAVGARLADDVMEGTEGGLRNPSDSHWDAYHHAVQSGFRTTIEEAKADRLDTLAIPALFVVDVSGEPPVATWHRIQGQMMGVRSGGARQEGNRRVDTMAEKGGGDSTAANRAPEPGDTAASPSPKQPLRND